jgi:2-polyprenyl-6-hydroxyphenyl methylase/3-demethylubiquinone-9 3-methyltransferase
VKPDLRNGDERFDFGKNWASYLSLVDADRITAAERSLTEYLGDLASKTFVDIGCGSGLFSLAARNLGAKVTSLDYDPGSVACAKELRRLHRPNDPQWTIRQGSALDDGCLRELGQFDVVYSWGVLHHTGDMWRGLGNMKALGLPGGKLFISIYNDQGAASRVWRRIKRHYNRSGRFGRAGLIAMAGLYFSTRSAMMATLSQMRLTRQQIEHSEPVRARGMDRRHDLIDWVGGYPFEVATPEAVFSFFHRDGFDLDYLKTCGSGLGCNEFVFTYPSE